jgi:hypothetical protein
MPVMVMVMVMVMMMVMGSWLLGLWGFMGVMGIYKT